MSYRRILHIRVITIAAYLFSLIVGLLLLYLAGMLGIEVSIAP